MQIFFVIFFLLSIFPLNFVKRSRRLQITECRFTFGATSWWRSGGIPALPFKSALPAAVVAARWLLCILFCSSKYTCQINFAAIENMYRNWLNRIGLWNTTVFPLPNRERRDIPFRRVWISRAHYANVRLNHDNSFC